MKRYLAHQTNHKKMHTLLLLFDLKLVLIGLESINSTLQQLILLRVSFGFLFIYKKMLR